MEKVFVKVSFLFSLMFLAAVLFCPSDTWLESENRYVSEMSLTDSAFIDRLPMRTFLMRANRDITLALGKTEFAGAFLGGSGYIFSTEDTSLEVLSQNLLFALEFANGIETHLCIVPQKVDVLYRYLPRFYDGEREQLWSVAAKSELYISDVLPTLLLAANNSKYVYYRGDHHTTALGSYYIYKSLSSALSYIPYSSDDFSVGIVKSDFSGSDARKMLTKTNDKIALFRYKGDSEFVAENLDSGKVYQGLYDYDKLLSNDPYGIYPFPDCGRAQITCDAGREKLLLICDSYGDSLCPFLARHFDIDIVDPRYFGGSVKKMLDENDYAAALICFGMDTLAGKEILYKLVF